MKIIGHSKQIEFVKQLIQNEKLPHALLLTGPEGIGKKLFAFHLAQSLFCENSLPLPPSQIGRGWGEGVPCETCKHCIRISENKHPDFLFISPENQLIKVDAIRDLKQKLSFKPFEATYKVALIDDADTLHPSAANILLKTLEEPPEKTILILTSPSPHQLLKTILSRCQKITFFPLQNSEMDQVSFLIKEEKSSPEKLLLAQGSPGQLFKFSEEAFDMIENEILPSLESQPKNLMKLLQVSETLSKEEKLAESVLDLLLMKWGANIPSNPNPIFVKKTKAIYEASRKLKETHANPQLTFENLFFKLCL